MTGQAVGTETAKGSLMLDLARVWNTQPYLIGLIRKSRHPFTIWLCAGGHHFNDAQAEKQKHRMWNKCYILAIFIYPNIYYLY